jgi:hypothetical protein
MNTTRRNVFAVLLAPVMAFFIPKQKFIPRDNRIIDEKMWDERKRFAKKYWRGETILGVRDGSDMGAEALEIDRLIEIWDRNKWEEA